MTTEDFQAHAQILLDSWTSTGSELRNSIPVRDMIAIALQQAYADGQADIRKQFAAILATRP